MAIILPTLSVTTAGFHLEHHVVRDDLQVVFELELFLPACVFQSAHQPREGCSTVVHVRLEFQLRTLLQLSCTQYS
jgi:hypothetical protein